MRRVAAVNEAVQVKAQARPSGELRVKAFEWQGRWHYVAAHGRRWEESTEGRRIRCFLVETLDSSAFELRWDPVEDEWALHQAWLADMV